MSTQEKILKPKDVADFLHLHERTVKKMALAGDLPGFRISGQWRFRQSAVDRYIAEREKAELASGGANEQSTLQ